MRALLCAFALCVGAAWGQLVVNEIMFKPSTLPEETPEWFELLNVSDSTVNLSGWMYSDIGEGTSHDPVVITGDDFSVPPGGYVVVAKFSWETLPDSITLVPDTWRALNNTGTDGVRLWSPESVLVDSAVYVVDEHPCVDYGISLERIDPWGSSVDQANWDCSSDPSGATPGRRNSVFSAPESLDLAVVAVELEPEQPLPNEEFSVIVEVRNVGLVQASGFSLELRYVAGGETTFVGSASLPEIPPDSSVTESFSLALPEGTYTLIACVDDTVGENNSLSRSLSVYEPGAAPNVLVTEVMFKPSTIPEETPEWVELYNAGDAPADLAGWYVCDEYDCVVIAESSVVLAPGEFVVVAEFLGELDTCGCPVVVPADWRSFNNDGDAVQIRDAESLAVDSFYYDPDDYPCIDYGVSLERIDVDAPSTDPSNWGCCRTASTPCRENSLWQLEFTAEVSVEVSPNPFDPEVENSSIKVSAPVDAVVELRIYDLRGRLVRDFGETSLTTWDGRNDRGEPVPTGAYVVVAQVEQGGKVEHHRVPIAVARGMR